jgi:hypothetical protein
VSGIRNALQADPGNPRLGLSARPYRWNGRPELSIAAESARKAGKTSRAGAPTTQQQASRRRRELFAELRDEGLSVLAAGKACGVAHKTAYRYEEQRLLAMLGAES